MTLIAPDSWRPIGIDFLEPAAWTALRHPCSTCVVAGPGAGKTEFLAQRATYLLQTGTCPPPYKILAISFKSDAADNLAKRVRQRCPPEQAERFVSMTFDSFTKGLVDRFYTKIPQDWRPTRPYEIEFPKSGYIEKFLMALSSKVNKDWQTEIMAISQSKFEPYYVGAHKLPIRKIEPSSGKEFAIYQWFEDFLFGGQASSLTFVMINRLAECVNKSETQKRHKLGKLARSRHPIFG